MPKCDFNKVALHIFRIPFRRNTSEWLLLEHKIKYRYIFSTFDLSATFV